MGMETGMEIEKEMEMERIVIHKMVARYNI